MTTKRIKYNSVKGLILFIVFTVLSLHSCTVKAQVSREMRDAQIMQRVKVWEDSVHKANRNPKFMGTELSLSFPSYKLNSALPQLAGMNVSMIGTNLGGVWANSVVMVKGKAGMYQSNSSMPYKIYMLQGNVSAGVYLLRLKTIKYHTFEPYVSVGASYQQAKFYGYYLPTDDDGKPVSTNYSNTDSPMLGKTGSTFINVTTGVEYQLESDTHVFIHLFAEVNYGILISSQASNASFNGTTPSNLSAVSVGISFGSIR